jgi:hypothetical protein
MEGGCIMDSWQACMRCSASWPGPGGTELLVLAAHDFPYFPSFYRSDACTALSHKNTIAHRPSSITSV